MMIPSSLSVSGGGAEAEAAAAAALSSGWEMDKLDISSP